MGSELSRELDERASVISGLLAGTGSIGPWPDLTSCSPAWSPSVQNTPTRQDATRRPATPDYSSRRDHRLDRQRSDRRLRTSLSLPPQPPPCSSPRFGGSSLSEMLTRIRHIGRSSLSPLLSVPSPPRSRAVPHPLCSRRRSSPSAPSSRQHPPKTSSQSGPKSGVTWTRKLLSSRRPVRPCSLLPGWVSLPPSLRQRVLTVSIATDHPPFTRLRRARPSALPFVRLLLVSLLRRVSLDRRARRLHLVVQEPPLGRHHRAPLRLLVLPPQGRRLLPAPSVVRPPAVVPLAALRTRRRCRVRDLDHGRQALARGRQGCRERPG